MSNRVTHLLIALGIFVAEVLIATTFSHIVWVRAYLGDLLATLLLYHIGKVLYNFSPLPLAFGVFLFSVVLEFAQYLHVADALGLPKGSLLRLLIGSNFSWLDILMYALGCVVACLVDLRLIRQRL